MSKFFIFFNGTYKKLEKSLMGGLADSAADALSGKNPVDKMGEALSSTKYMKSDKKFEKVMHEFKMGTLRSGNGEIVKSREQALAIAGKESGKYMEEDEEFKDDNSTEEKPMKKAFVKIYDNIFLKINNSEDMEKAKKAAVGETATWADGKTYRKVSESKWELVADHPGAKKHSEASGERSPEDVSTPSKLHEKFRVYMENMSDEHRAIFRGGKMDFEKRMFHAPNGKVALQYKGGNIHIIKMGEMSKASERSGHKYIKRVPKSTGKGYNYFYTRQQWDEYKKTGKVPEQEGDKEGRVWASILSFFGLDTTLKAKNKVKQIYENHKEKLGVDLKKFADHLNEYLSNKDKWDARFSKVPGEKKESSSKTEKPKIGKERESSGGGEKWDTALMKKIAGIVGGMDGQKKEGVDESAIISGEGEKLENLSGKEVLISSRYGPMYPGMKGKVIKEFEDNNGNKFIKLDLGKNAGGQKMTTNVPVNSVYIPTDEEINENKEKGLKTFTVVDNNDSFKKVRVRAKDSESAKEFASSELGTKNMQVFEHKTIEKQSGKSAITPEKAEGEKSSKRKVGSKKEEFVQFIKNQIGVDLQNDENYLLNKKRDYLYTEIPSNRKTMIMSYLNKIGINPESHIKDNYWIPLSKEVIDKAIKSNDKTYDFEKKQGDKREIMSEKQKEAASVLGIKETDSEELRKLKLDKSKLETKALKQFPSSPIQKKTREEINELSKKIKEMESKEKSPLSAAAEKLDEAVKGKDNFSSFSEYMLIKRNEINKELKSANDEQEKIKKDNPGWKKDEKDSIKIEKLNNKIYRLSDERQRIDRGETKNEYRKIVEKKEKLSPSDMNDFPDIAADKISKESGINFHHDKELGKNFRAKYHDKKIEIDNIGSNGYRIRVDGNTVKEDKTYEDRMFKSPKEIREYLDSRKETEDKSAKETSDNLASQGWEPTKLDKTDLVRNAGTPSRPDVKPVDPKDIRKTFKVWGEDVFIMKMSGGFYAMEKKTGLSLARPNTSINGAIEAAKDVLLKQGKEKFNNVIRENSLKDRKEKMADSPMGDYRNPNSLTDDQVHTNVMEAAKMSMSQLEKNSDAVNKQIAIEKRKKNRPDVLKKLDFVGSVYRVAQLHKDKNMSKEEIVNLIDTGAELNRKPMQKASQLSTGTKIESEHKPTVDFITKYVKNHGKMPPALEVYRHIAQNHIDGSGGESGIKDYYTRLLAMEKQAKVKRPKIELDVIDFLSKNPNPPDSKVHAFAEKIKINPHDLEKVFYKLATESAKMEVNSSLKKASNDLFQALEKAKKMPVGTVSKGRKKVSEGKWVPVKEGKEKPKEEKPEEKPPKNDDKKDKKGGVSEEHRVAIKSALKKVANILAEAFSGKGGVQAAGEAVEQGGENIQERAKRISKQKNEGKK
jgi:Rps23 Pro-64 3,4-dihydroxylase Tpa1-like proline 4-hydroxylase